MKNTFAPIFTRMLDSSVWEEPLHVRVLWVAMLALKDHDHIVRFQDYQLSRRANLTFEMTKDALRILSSPDERRPDQEFDGRRLQKVEDGWLILNGQLYEDEMRRLSRNVYQARKQREYREARKIGKVESKPDPRDTGKAAREALLAGKPPWGAQSTRSPGQGQSGDGEGQPEPGPGP